jgi:hypothetical protein
MDSKLLAFIEEQVGTYPDDDEVRTALSCVLYHHEVPVKYGPLRKLLDDLVEAALLYGKK